MMMMMMMDGTSRQHQHQHGQLVHPDLAPLLCALSLLAAYLVSPNLSTSSRTGNPAPAMLFFTVSLFLAYAALRSGIHVTVLSVALSSLAAILYAVFDDGLVRWSVLPVYLLPDCHH